MSRPSKDDYFMSLALVAAGRTTCIRRGVGCVLVDIYGRILSIAYNGVAAGLPHCNEDHPCAGHDLPPGLDQCEAVHAEQNALIQCADTERIYAAYVTLSPCKACLKLLLNTPCKHIIFLEEHVDPMPKSLWLKTNRTWRTL